jgi:hypothetical protein
MPVEALNDLEYIRLERKEPAAAVVTIREIRETRRVSIPLTPQNLPPEFTVWEELPQADLEVSAAQLTMERLDTSRFSAVLDCSGIAAEGTYELPVVVTIPYEFTLESQTLASFALTIVPAPPVPLKAEAPGQEGAGE